LKGEGEEIVERDEPPSYLHSPLPLISEGGRGIGGLVFSKIKRLGNAIMKFK
jgi:hypothetical protein